MGPSYARLVKNKYFNFVTFLSIAVIEHTMP